MKVSPYVDLTWRSFAEAGGVNTDPLLEAVAAAAEGRGIDTVIVATCTGRTALAALAALGGRANLVAVTHVTGFVRPNHQEMEPAVRKKLEEGGVKVLTAQHAFGGVGRAVRKKLGTYQLDEIMAYTLRIFGQGVKVAVEIALMAADAGLVRTDRDVISVGGTEQGADAAIVCQPANSADFFNFKVRGIIAKPWAF